MICSILIPSRNRFDLLRDCIDSILKSTKHHDQIEIVVRLHKSDSVSLSRFSELNSLKNVVLIQGEDLDGYRSLGVFYKELTMAARGQWLCQMNDDMLLSHEGRLDWVQQIASIPHAGFMAQPENHRLNNSLYIQDPESPCPFYPRWSLEKHGLNDYPYQIDKATHETLVKMAGWKVVYLSGLTVSHKWSGVNEFA